MTEFRISPAGVADIEEVASLLRDVDRDEINDACGSDPLPALMGSLTVGQEVRCLRANGAAVCVYGMTLNQHTPGHGYLWLVGTDLVDVHWRHFLRLGRQQLNELTAGLTHAENWSSVRNSKTIAWLEWLGFTIEPARPWGVHGALFHHFWKDV